VASAVWYALGGSVACRMAADGPCLLRVSSPEGRASWKTIYQSASESAVLVSMASCVETLAVLPKLSVRRR
jgi:hypothetical protein